MASLFSCQQLSTYNPAKTCIFSGVSRCEDRVSPLICNRHAAIYGLINIVAHYHDGDNNSWSKIVTYAHSTSNINIPLFTDSNNKVNMNEVSAFCINAHNNFPDINYERLIRCMTSLLEIDATSCFIDCSKSWYDDIGSFLLVKNNTGSIQFFKELPLLHKCLFYFINASTIRNIKAESETYLVPNLVLTRSDSDDTYAFTVPNKKLLLKYTDKPNCVATPLVINGIREISYKQTDRVYKPITTNGFNEYC